MQKTGVTALRRRDLHCGLLKGPHRPIVPVSVLISISNDLGRLGGPGLGAGLQWTTKGGSHLLKGKPALRNIVRNQGWL